VAALARAWWVFWFTPGRPENLGVCRLLFFGGMLLLYGPRDFSEWAHVDPVFWRPVMLIHALRLPLFSAEVLSLLQAVWKTALALSCVGLLTRVSTAAALLGGVYFLALPQNFGVISHMDMAPLLVLAVMALSRCGDAWSLDRLIGAARHPEAPGTSEGSTGGENTWPVRMVWVVLALVFFSAGVTKLRRSGLEWALSDQLALILAGRSLELTWTLPTSWGLTVAERPWLSRSLAVVTLLVELGYPLSLVSGAARRVLVPCTLLMLIGFRILLGPYFTPVMLCHVFWVPWTTLGPGVPRALVRRRVWALRSDGCGGAAPRSAGAGGAARRDERLGAHQPAVPRPEPGQLSAGHACGLAPGAARP
jgi:hypothetical protein